MSHGDCGPCRHGRRWGLRPRRRSSTPRTSTTSSNRSSRSNNCALSSVHVSCELRVSAVSAAEREALDAASRFKAKTSCRKCSDRNCCRSSSSRPWAASRSRAEAPDEFSSKILGRRCVASVGADVSRVGDTAPSPPTVPSSTGAVLGTTSCPTPSRAVPPARPTDGKPESSTATAFRKEFKFRSSSRSDAISALRRELLLRALSSACCACAWAAATAAIDVGGARTLRLMTLHTASFPLRVT
mmetsp:Transcript_48024/g.134023  ORF Transcript_48024/g.134023 Transcript_48024/m.134023 type:complete len:243 (+) Transcript_48024:1443-2171(+)